MENVENNLIVENNLSVENNLIVEKAKAILRAKLPALSELGLNFEKRTGNFFTATLEKVPALDNEGVPRTNNKGDIIYEIDADGAYVQRQRRLVVELVDEGGELKPEYEAVKSEINAKRAAAYVERYESECEKIEKRVEELKQEIEALNRDRDVLIHRYEQACGVVNATELPEKTTMERVKLSAKLSDAEETIAKMRALLLAAGIDPDTAEV